MCEDVFEGRRQGLGAPHFFDCGGELGVVWMRWGYRFDGFMLGRCKGKEVRCDPVEIALVDTLVAFIPGECYAIVPYKKTEIRAEMQWEGR